MPADELVQKVSLRTNDFDQLSDAATDWDQQYFQMSPGLFEGGIELTQVGSRQIFRERWGRKIRYRGTAPLGAFGFALPFGQPGDANFVGKTAGVDTVVVQAPGQEADLVTSDYWDALILGVSEEEVQAIVSTLSDRNEIDGKIHGVVHLRPDVAARLRRMGVDFFRMSKLATAQDEVLVMRLSEQFVKMFLWEILEAQADAEFLIKPVRSANTVNQATDLVLSDQTGRIGLAEICTQLGLSLRTLHYAFQDVTGVSPATWLRRLRLNQVHRTLQQSAPDEVLIKQVALESGFFHLGHFSRLYRHHFGCLPSQTLQSP